MPRAETHLREEIEAMGYVLVRATRHMIYAHPCGATLTTSLSPSDHRAVKNALGDAKRELRKRGVAV